MKKVFLALALSLVASSTFAMSIHEALDDAQRSLHMICKLRGYLKSNNIPGLYHYQYDCANGYKRVTLALDIQNGEVVDTRVSN